VNVHPYIRIGVLFLGLSVIWLFMMLATGNHQYSLSRHVLNAALASALTVPLIALLRSRLDRGTLAGLGLPFSSAAIRPLIVGAVAFVLPSLTGIAIVLILGWSSIVPQFPMAEIIAFVPLLIILVFFFEALPEELAFRGYIYAALAERHSRIVSIIVQSALFACWGAALWTISTGTVALDRFVMFAAVAFVLGLVRVMTGSVWACVGLHTAWQTTAQLILHANRGHFAVDGAEMLQMIAFGVVPFSLVALIVGLLYRAPVGWLQVEGTVGRA